MLALPHVADSHPIPVQKDGASSATVAQDIMLDACFSGRLGKGGDCIGSRGGVFDTLGKALHQKLIVWADCRQEVHPTDSAVRPRKNARLERNSWLMKV